MASASPARRRAKGWAVFSVTLITVVASISFLGFASASPNQPTVRRFQLHPPQATSAGGDEIITAAVARASTCRLTSTPPLLGLPASVHCGGGSFRRVVRLPANHGAAKTYRLVLAATARGTSTTATRKLVQSPFIPLLSWGTPKIVDTSGSLDSVACPTTTWCMAADSLGDVVAFDGSSWTAPAPVGAKYVSCPTTSFCAATTFGREILTFDGTTWSPPSPVGPTGTIYWAVSCSSAAHCVALGNDGAAIDNDGDWSYKPLGTSSGIIDTVSCPTLSFCMAVGLDANSVAYNGTRWTDAGGVVPPVGNTGVSGAVSCAPSRWCMYVGNGSGINTPDELGYADTYSGKRWTGPVVIEPAGRPRVNGVSCLPNGYCVAVDASGDARTHIRGEWSRLVEIDPRSRAGLSAVSCASMTFCVAVGFGGDVIVGR